MKTVKPLISNMPRAFPDRALKSQTTHSGEDIVIKHCDVSALPVFDGLIKKTPFKNFSSKNSSEEGSRISSPQSSTRSGIVYEQNMKTEPSTPVLSRDSSVDKTFHQSKSLNFEKKSVQGILKTKEKSRFSHYGNKSSRTRRSTSTQKVKIME